MQWKHIHVVDEDRIVTYMKKKILSEILLTSFPAFAQPHEFTSIHLIQTLVSSTSPLLELQGLKLVCSFMPLPKCWEISII